MNLCDDERNGSNQILMIETYKGIKTFHAKSRHDWRDWLEKHHAKESAVWLIFYKKNSGVPSVYYDEAVDEALCFGWIDSKPNKRDDSSYYQFFAKRNPKSNWSRVNKEKVEKLLLEGHMHASGLEMVEIAKLNGTWNALDDVENLQMPVDLQRAFELNPVALGYWEAFPRSAKRGILEWILNAKRDETRLKRITETVELASQNIRASNPRSFQGYEQKS